MMERKQVEKMVSWGIGPGFEEGLSLGCKDALR